MKDEGYAEQKHCCTVCAAKRKCHVCGDQTALCCSNCAINFGSTIYVCRKAACRDKHEQKCFGDGRSKHAAESRLAACERVVEAARAVNEAHRMGDCRFNGTVNKIGDTIARIDNLRAALRDLDGGGDG